MLSTASNPASSVAPRLARPAELDAVTVEYGSTGRVVVCFCGKTVPRSIVPHLKKHHAAEWAQWTCTFVRLRGEGYSLKKIMRLFQAGNGRLLFSWTVVERAIRREVEGGQLSYRPPPTKAVQSWYPTPFVLEKTTVWDFPTRGNWAVHSGDYRGNWPPQVPRNLIESFTSKGDLVVDAFVGGGTTLIEAWLLGRRSLGLDISALALQTCSVKLGEMESHGRGDHGIALDNGLRPRVVCGDALALESILNTEGVEPGAVGLICAHPPYLDSIPYSLGQPCDLSSSSDPDSFCAKLGEFAGQALKALRPGGVCAVLIGDVRRHGATIPLGFMTLRTFLAGGFELDNIVVKTQHKDRSSEFYIKRRDHRLLMAHEYLFLLRNPPPR